MVELRRHLQKGWLLGLAILMVHCGKQAPSIPKVAENRPGWQYEVRAGTQAHTLFVEATIDAGYSESFGVEEGAEAFVHDVMVNTGHGFVSVKRSGTEWKIPTCFQKGCRIRYQFDLNRAAEKITDVDQCAVYGDTLLSPPSTWLLRPTNNKRKTRVRLHVQTPKNLSYVSGVYLDPHGKTQTYELSSADLFLAPYSGFGHFEEHTLELNGGKLLVAFAPGDYQHVTTKQLLRWIKGRADMLVQFYGKFPISRAVLFVIPQSSHRVNFGKTLGNGGASIVLWVGNRVKEKTLNRDWILLHELIHVAFPSLRLKHSWLEEGISTYMEPLIRLQSGELTTEEVLAEFHENMPNGLPDEGDLGLDRTPTWGRTYWGGALFCLLTDIEIRKQTHLRFGFREVLQSIVWNQGNIAHRWPIERVLRIGEQAVGNKAFSELYQTHALTSQNVDLEHLWRDLGVEFHGRTVTLNNQAPLASIRQTIFLK
jgi:hypothetical protein